MEIRKPVRQPESSLIVAPLKVFFIQGSQTAGEGVFRADVAQQKSTRPDRRYEKNGRI